MKEAKLCDDVHVEACTGIPAAISRRRPPAPVSGPPRVVGRELGERVRVRALAGFLFRRTSVRGKGT